MEVIEFTTELGGSQVLPIPSEAAARLPKTGKARVIVISGEDADDLEWRKHAYEQFLRDDAPEDAIYERYR